MRAPSSLLVHVAGAVEELLRQRGGALLAVRGLRHEEAGQGLLPHGGLQDTSFRGSEIYSNIRHLHWIDYGLIFW